MANTNAQRMVELLEQAMTENIGVNSISVDGVSTSFSSRDAMIKELLFWKSEAAKSAGKRSPFRGIDIGSAW